MCINKLIHTLYMIPISVNKWKNHTVILKGKHEATLKSKI